MRTALEGKYKLGYIDGSYMRPHDGSVDLKQWQITESLVRTWILSTMVKEIVNSFLYVPSARALWLELESSIRSQILVLDPLPSVNKAYSMVLRVGRQRKVNLEYVDIGENNAMNVRNMEYKLNTGQKSFQKRKTFVDKRKLICEHCGKIGHSKDSCFKLHGTPEWYKDLNKQKKWGTATNRAYNATDALLSEESKTMQRNEVLHSIRKLKKLALEISKLKRSLYGLKQASRQWSLEFTAQLVSFGFVQFSYDHYLFTKQFTEGIIALIVYVDDVLITCPCGARIAEVKHFLNSTFTIEDLGLAKYFLGLEIARSTAGSSITQHKFIRDVIRDAGLESAKPACSPLPAGLKLSSHTSAPLSDPEPFRRLVRRLLDLSFTRPDISFGAQQLSQFVHTPCQIHLDAALHLVRYLNGCPERGLLFPASNSLALTAFCDADWASCVDSRRSLTGYCIFLGDALISWKTKKQTTVSRSTAEAEYRSLAATCCELQWITYLLSDFHIQIPTPIPLFCDNQAALHIVANPVFHERTKHIELDCRLVRDLFKSGFVFPQHISGTQQLADVLTKSLSGSQFSNLLSKMGLRSFPQVHLEGG
ncbi:UNVERIFIED_CONTAM: Retrovirus-related Pol polyprotein from transposon RE1 [Sesamum radiatum]|uniref:Retrovirus-related Pol polyprotein from transposon RE1 n=1 Tax=Sesamum radiatum TaxID=300843 RepID=A0AAW2VQZ4_SESRA